MRSAPDEALMEWAATQGRVILTDDRRDFPRLVHEWNTLGQNFSGVVLVGVGRSGSTGDLLRSIEHHITPDPARLRNSLTWLPLLRE